MVRDLGVEGMYASKTRDGQVDYAQQGLEKTSTSTDPSSRRTLPSLSALRAFEAAARYRSLSVAAQELNVTTSAISHQIKALEVWLGKQLFTRDTRPLVLTEAGAVYFRSVGGAFDRVAEATRNLLGEPARETLTVSTMHSFAATWLIPKLEQFRATHAWLDVRVLADSRYLDLTKEDCDVAIRYGNGQWPGTTADPLLEDRRIAVCSPKLLGADQDRGFSLERQTLIHDRSRPGWKEWFAQGAAPKDRLPNQGMFFTHSYLAVQAAARGYGVALASEPLVADALTAGELASPCPRVLRGSGAYYLVTPSGSKGRGKIRIFCDWLLEEARTSSPTSFA